MSALSKSSIIHEIASGRLVVSPIIEAEQIGPSSVDLRMGTVVIVARAGRRSEVDPSDYREDGTHQSVEGRKQKHDRFDVLYHEPFLLHPGALALVPTLEWISIPHSLQGIVTARSSWAREGLNIATATIVNPGYLGVVTLELANFGEIPIRLYPGLRIAQLALYRLDQHDPSQDENFHKADARQFTLAFEPEAGNISKRDGAFIPK